MKRGNTRSCAALRGRAFLCAALLLPSIAAAAGSTCFGSVSHGRLADGVALPESGANFTAYSSTAAVIGRTYVHSKVNEVVLEAYKVLEKSAPAKVFVYGETGWKSGGRFRPHRTHQNGLSVDFMVPVLDKSGRSIPLPTSAFNKFGYGIEFDRSGHYGDLTIDFSALAEHLYQLDRAAYRHGLGIALVIFDRDLLPRLLATPRGPYLEQRVQFMKGKPWIRHDEHYHVDFAMACQPLGRFGKNVVRP